VGHFALAAVLCVAAVGTIGGASPVDAAARGCNKGPVDILY
jgi:hypothetical protein